MANIDCTAANQVTVKLQNFVPKSRPGRVQDHSISLAAHADHFFLDIRTFSGPNVKEKSSLGSETTIV